MSSLFVDSPECRALPYYFTALESAIAYDAFQKRMAKEYPGAWPWPVSGVTEAAPITPEQWTSLDKPKPEAQHFDTEAHRAFMRGLG